MRACSLTCFSQNINLEIHFPLIITIFRSSQMRSCFISDSDMLRSMGVSISFTVFVKFVRNAVGVPWWSLNIADSIDTCIIHMGYVTSTCITIYGLCGVSVLRSTRWSDGLTPPLSTSLVWIVVRDRRSILWSEARETITKIVWSVAIVWIKYRKLRNAWADNTHTKYR